MLWRWCWDNMQTWSTDAQNNRSEPNVKEEVMGRLARHFFPPPNLWTNNLNNSLNNKVIGFWLLFKYTWLRNLSKDAGREKPSSEEKNAKTTQMNYSFESHKILKIASWWLPDWDVCSCCCQHASLNTCFNAKVSSGSSDALFQHSPFCPVSCGQHADRKHRV